MTSLGPCHEQREEDSGSAQAATFRLGKCLSQRDQLLQDSLPSTLCHYPYDILHLSLDVLRLVTLNHFWFYKSE